MPGRPAIPVDKFAVIATTCAFAAGATNGAAAARAFAVVRIASTVATAVWFALPVGDAAIPVSNFATSAGRSTATLTMLCLLVFRPSAIAALTLSVGPATFFNAVKSALSLTALYSLQK